MRLKVLSALMHINYIKPGIEAERFDIQIRFTPHPQAKTDSGKITGRDLKEFSLELMP